MKVTRRTAIGGAAAAAGVAAFGGYRVLAPMSDPAGAIAQFIARQVPGVQPTDPAVTAFAADAAEKFRPMANFFETHIALMRNPAFAGFLPEQEAWTQSEFERRIITYFMRSTDYMLRSAPDQPVTYLLFADPYTAGCSNPLAKLG